MLNPLGFQQGAGCECTPFTSCVFFCWVGLLGDHTVLRTLALSCSQESPSLPLAVQHGLADEPQMHFRLCAAMKETFSLLLKPHIMPRLPDSMSCEQDHLFSLQRPRRSFGNQMKRLWTLKLVKCWFIPLKAALSSEQDTDLCPELFGHHLRLS